MKKLMIGLAMVVALAMVANVAFTDETVPFPFWQHGYGIMSFWSVVNAGTADATVTINGLDKDGTLHFSTSSTVSAGGAWLPASYDAWWTYADGAGFGNYAITATEDALYLWGCVFGVAADGTTPGYTVVMPGNPYGL